MKRKVYVLVFVLAFSVIAVGDENIFGGGGESTPDEKFEQIKRKLENTKVNVDFKDITLEELRDYLTSVHDLNVIIDQDCYEGTSPEDLKLNLTVKNLALKTTLKLILEQRNLTMTYEDGVLKIIPRSKLDKNLVTRIYDIRDLLFQIRDFPGPNLTLQASEEEEGASITTDVFVGESENRGISDPELIERLIKETIEPETWSENASLQINNGMLIVSQSKRIHAKIREFLDMLRQFK